jgi:hypothetical protein
MIFTNSGICPYCSKAVVFEARQAWLRDHYVCPSCGSIPRERALIWTIEHFFPSWRNLAIHECSAVFRGASSRLRAECRNYTPTQYFTNVSPGKEYKSFRCENIERLTFPDESIDLHVTKNVMEHVFDPASAFREIARTLRPGGAHVFTTPLVNKERNSERRAQLGPDGAVDHLHPAEYHGNPVSDKGSLVTMHWGYDITDFIASSSGLFTTVVYIDQLDAGIRAEYIEVLVTRKPALAGALGPDKSA